MDLTDKQLTLWKELGSDFSAPPQLCQQARNFYQTYKQTEPFTFDKADLILKVAYFLAEKAQVLFDREGHRLQSIAISANSILRDHPKHEQFLYHLLQMVRSISIPAESPHLQQQVSIFSRHFSSSMTFLNKLKGTLKKIKINRKIQEPNEYQQLATRLLWLVFVDAKNDLQLGIDIIDSTCLLGSVLCFYIIQKYKEDGIFSIYFEHEGEGTTLSNEQEELSAFLLNYFHIKDLNTYSNITIKMQKYLSLLERNLDMKRFFHCQNISKNIYFVQKQYEKKLTDGKLDESTFLKNYTNSNLPAIRLTPFARKAPLAPKNYHGLSHRILTFDNWEEGQENKGFLDNKKDEKAGLQFLNKVKMHPTPKGTLIRATPVSEAMETYNWLFEKRQRYVLNKEEMMMIEETFEVSLLMEKTQELRKDHCELAGSLWKECLNKYEALDPRTLLLVSVYVVCHVLNTSTNDIEVPIELLQLQHLSVWEVLDQMINTFDRNMPLSLKLNLLTLETSFISSRLWVNQDNVFSIKTGKNQNTRLIKRVIHQGAFILSALSKKLQINDDVSDASFLIFQQSLQAEDDILHEKMLEHLIVCSLFAASKVKESPLKFNDILPALKEVLGLASGPYQELAEAVKIEERRQSIITYYNSLFIPSVRHYLRQMKLTAVPEASPGIIGTKIKEVIFREVASLSSPQMANYFAYCESPILKNRCLREMSLNNGGVNSTIKRETTYSLADIQAKFSRFGGSKLRQTRRVLKF